MPDPLVTLTTDFGTDSPYLAAMKGVLLGINPAARLVDLSHDIPPQDLRHASFFLAEALPWFPPETLHVVVVDPGVGSQRHVLHVLVAGQRLLVPDNGCWTLLAESQPGPTQVRRLTQPRFWREAVSATFHGRDILAPVAGHLSLGLDPAELGERTADWVRLPWPAPVATASGLLGEVLFVDHFGNLITNLPGDFPGCQEGKVKVTVLSNPLPIRRVRTYADAQPGELVWLTSSGGRLEVAVAQGHAGRHLHVGAGAQVEVNRLS